MGSKKALFYGASRCLSNHSRSNYSTQVHLTEKGAFKKAPCSVSNGWIRLELPFSNFVFIVGQPSFYFSRIGFQI